MRAISTNPALQCLIAISLSILFLLNAAVKGIASNYKDLRFLSMAKLSICVCKCVHVCLCLLHGNLPENLLTHMRGTDP